MLGGTSAAIVDADAMIAAMKGGLYPSFFIGPPSARLMTATSAVVDPDISEKNMLKTVTTCDRPPRICPTRASDRFTTRTTTFEELINSPTRRKNGMGTPKYPKNRKQNVISPSTTGELTGGLASMRGLNRGHGHRLAHGLWMIEAVTAAIDQLL